MNASFHPVPRRRLRITGLLVGVLLLGVAFRAQLVDLVNRGQATLEQGYIFLVPLVAAYLILIRLGRLRGERSHRGAWFGPVIVAMSFICSAIGHDRDILILWQAAPVVGLLGLIVAALGMRRSIALAPGLVVMFASLPVPGVVRQMIAEPLQGLATYVTASVLNLMGVEAENVGYLIEINGIPVAIGEACNGMRLVMPLAIVIYAFVFSLPLKPMTRFVLIMLSLPVALVCNIIRLVPTALAYGYVPQHAVEIHDYLGWMMIPLALGLLLGILRMFEWLDLPVARFRLAVA